MTDAPVRVAVLSAIRHGDYMAPALAATPGIEVVAIVDEPNLPERWRDRGPRVAQELGVPFSEDVEGLLARDDVEGIMVTAEYVRHAALAVRVLEAGKHLLVDKPMATSLADARAIARAAIRAERNGIRAMSSSNFAAPAAQRARAAIQAGKIGEIRAVHGECVASYGPGDLYDPVADELGWHPRWTGGGEILNFALYPLSEIRFMTRLEVDAVHCFGGALFNRAHRELGIDDLSHITLQFEGGAVGDLIVGRSHTPTHFSSTKYDELIRVIGTRGLVDADGNDPYVSIYGRPDVGAVGKFFDDSWIPDLMARFHRFIRGGVDPEQSIVDSLRVMEVVFAAQESLQTGHVVRIDRTTIAA